MTKTLSILVFASFVQACSLNKQDSAPKQLTKMEEFELKTRCAGYWDRTVKELQSITGPSGQPGPTVEEMFYSPKLNTCVAGLSGTNEEAWALEDILSHHRYIFYELAKNNPDAEKRWEAKIEELKSN